MVPQPDTAGDLDTYEKGKARTAPKYSTITVGQQAASTLHLHTIAPFISHHLLSAHNHLSPPSYFSRALTTVYHQRSRRTIFYVLLGSVQVASRPHLTLPEGVSFGEGALVTSVRREATVVALEPCHLAQLTAETLVGLENVEVSKQARTQPPSLTHSPLPCLACLLSARRVAMPCDRDDAR